MPQALGHFKPLRPEGFDLLGSPIGTQAYCQQFFAQKLVKYREVWGNIQKLDHLQTQAVLLRYCKVVHLFRTVPPFLLVEEFGTFDHEFRVRWKQSRAGHRPLGVHGVEVHLGPGKF